MSYQALARKWRPQIFSDLVGQEHVLTAIVNSISLGRVHHAYLLSGTRGVGKTTIARLIAKGLNCETGIIVTPCGNCDNCLEIENNRFIDLIEIDAASRTKVEDTRELLDNVQYAPSRGRFKVYLIDEVHMLSRHSFNALLKTLEEPPAHVKFLLATTDPQKLPLTILSRCLQFHLKVIDVNKIYNQLSFILQRENIVTEPRALQLIAHAANGSMRDALSLTDQAIAIGQGTVSADGVSIMLGTINTEQPLSFIEALVNADGKKIITQLEQYAKLGLDWEKLIIEILSLLHQLALGQLIPDQFNNFEDPVSAQRLRNLALRLPPNDLQLYYQTLLIGRKELPFAPNPRMGVEMALLRALAFHPEIKDSMIKKNTEKKTAKLINTISNSKNNKTNISSDCSDYSTLMETSAKLKINYTKINQEKLSTSPIQNVLESSFKHTTECSPVRITVSELEKNNKNLLLPIYNSNNLVDDTEYSKHVGTNNEVVNNNHKEKNNCVISVNNLKNSSSNILYNKHEDKTLPELTLNILKARTYLLNKYKKNNK